MARIIDVPLTMYMRIHTHTQTHTLVTLVFYHEHRAVMARMFDT
jgi:hypothetical protein